MKIAIEAHALGQDKITGVGMVILHYINELQKIDHENEYYIYSMDPLRHVTIQNPRWHYVDCSGRLTALRRKTWGRWQDCAKAAAGTHNPLFMTRLLILRISKILLELIDEAIYTLRLVRSVKQAGIEVYLGTSTYYYPPFFCGPVRKAGIIYDLVWKLYPETMEFGNRIRMALFTPRNMKKLDLLIAISEQTKKDAQRILKLRTPIEAIPLAADERLFYPAPRSSVAAVKRKYGIDRPYLLSVSTLEPRKNLRSLIAAYRALPERHRYRLVLVGMIGWIEREFFEYLEGSDVREGVILTGYLPAEELAPLYRGASAFVFPSLYEGFGLPILEAMQCGCPVITSNRSSMPEVAGDAAILIDPEDVPSITRAMHAVLTDPRLRRTLSVKGKVQARRFSWRRSAQHLLSAITSLRHPPSPR